MTGLSHPLVEGGAGQGRAPLITASRVFSRLCESGFYRTSPTGGHHQAVGRPELGAGARAGLVNIISCGLALILSCVCSGVIDSFKNILRP